MVRRVLPSPLALPSLPRSQQPDGEKRVRGRRTASAEANHNPRGRRQGSSTTNRSPPPPSCRLPRRLHDQPTPTYTGRPSASSSSSSSFAFFSPSIACVPAPRVSPVRTSASFCEARGEGDPRKEGKEKPRCDLLGGCGGCACCVIWFIGFECKCF